MNQSPPSDRQVNLLDAVLMLGMVSGVGASFIWLPQNVTITIMLLLGIWWIDLFLKRLVGLGISTAFADLAFASLVFVSSRGISLINEDSLAISEQNSLINIVIISFLLGGIWLSNLLLSAIIEKPKSEQEKKIVQITSITTSIISVTIVVLSQFWGII